MESLACKFCHNNFFIIVQYHNDYVQHKVMQEMWN